MTPHSPTPWWTDPAFSESILDENQNTIAQCWVQYGGMEQPGTANAAHIVRCVNLHDELVAALTSALLIVENAPGLSVNTQAFRAVLAKAGGEVKP